MPEQTENPLADWVAQRQLEVAGVALQPWLIEAQLLEIEDALIGDDSELERRIGDGKFIALGAIATTSASIALGLLIHPAALLSEGWKLRRLLYFDRDYRPHAIALFAQLDGVDRDVFEAVHALCLELIVVNFERYEAEDFERALGREAPDADRIVRHLDLDAVVASKTLARLVRRGILRTDGSHYWIAA